jgi:hypothetical protein
MTGGSPSSACDHDRVLERARRYIAHIPGAISGQRGSSVTSHVACVLVRDFDLSISDALSLLEEWNATCSPPWTQRDLIRKLEWADAQSGVRGRLLNADRSWAPQDDEVGDVSGLTITILSASGSDGAEEKPSATDWGKVFEQIKARIHPADCQASFPVVQPLYPTSCGRLKRKGHRHDDPRQQVIGQLPCWSWGCEHCILWQRQRWSARYTCHLGRLGGDTIVYHACIRDSEWATYRKSISRASGRYGWAATDETHRLLVSTTPFRGSTPLPVRNAIPLLTGTVNAIPLGGHGKKRQCGCSRAWHPVDHEHKAGKYAWDHALNGETSMERYAAIVAAAGLESTERISRASPNQQSKRFLDYAIPEDWTRADVEWLEGWLDLAEIPDDVRPSLRQQDTNREYLLGLEEQIIAALGVSSP